MNVENRQIPLPDAYKSLLQDEGKSFDVGDHGRFLHSHAGDESAVGFLNWVFPYAKSIKASDVHLSWRESGCVVRIRHEDMLMSNQWLFTRQAGQLLNDKIRAKCRLPIHDIESSHDSSFWILDEDQQSMIDIRVSIVPTTFGANIVCRLGNQAANLPLEKIYMPDYVREKYLQVIDSPQGMIIVSGPTGSGKSATLAASLNYRNTPDTNIMTVEDPVENRIPGANQVSINYYRTFAGVLRSFLRQDPDIIMVGEIRDLETAEMAIQAALTGHLVFSTLHTSDAPSAITRLMELGVPSYLINATLLGVLAQRLVRTLCKQCKQPDTSAAPEALAEVVKPWKLSGTYQPFKAVGCVDCRMGGFLGRMGLYELLTVSEALKDKITQAPSIDVLRRQAVADGMRPLRLAGALRVAEGLTTLDEVVAGTPPLE